MLCVVYNGSETQNLVLFDPNGESRHFVLVLSHLFDCDLETLGVRRPFWTRNLPIPVGHSTSYHHTRWKRAVEWLLFPIRESSWVCGAMGGVTT